MSQGNYEVGLSLNCPICYEPYNNQERLPKMMNCLHTTCLTCIHDMIKAEIPEASAEVRRAGTVRGAASTQTDNLSQLERLRRRTTSTIPQRLPIPNLRPSMLNAPAPSVPELPNSKTFSCPLCRTRINTKNLQTNRYIIAHIEDINKLKRQSAKQTPRAQSALISTVLSRNSVSTSPTVEESWCVPCGALAKVNVCTDHEKVSLDEWIRTQSAKLKERATAMETNVDTQGANMRAIEGELQTIVSTTRTLLRKVESQNKEWKRIKGRLQSVYAGCETHNSRNFVSSISGGRIGNDANRAKTDLALKIQEMTKELERIRSDSIKIENAGVMENDCLMWSSDNKIYVKKGTKTYTISREDSTYAA